MELILLERIENLGQMGDVVKVKPGYARNYLLPRQKALRATEENRKAFKTQKVELEATNLKKREEAESVGAKLDGLTVTLIRQAGDAGQLYGSVNGRDVAEMATEAGFNLPRQQVKLPHPIKTLGLFPIKVSLHPEVAVTVTANVARSDEEARIQAETGRAVISEDLNETVEEAAPTVEELVEESVAEEIAEAEAKEAHAEEAPAEEAPAEEAPAEEAPAEEAPAEEAPAEEAPAAEEEKTE